MEWLAAKMCQQAADCPDRALCNGDAGAIMKLNESSATRSALSYPADTVRRWMVRS